VGRGGSNYPPELRERAVRMVAEVRPVHAIATFAGHRSTDSTLRYIHLSGQEVAAKLNSSMAQLHTWRVEMLTGPAAPGVQA